MSLISKAFGPDNVVGRDRLGRRPTLAIYFVCMLLSIAIGFYLPNNAMHQFFACLFFLGLGGANVAMYTL
jgi:MFS family permease